MHMHHNVLMLVRHGASAYSPAPHHSGQTMAERLKVTTSPQPTRPRVIVLTTQKGGTGKSTLATNIAVAAMQAGESVLGIDCDPQGTLAAWATLRSADSPAIAHLGSRESGRLGELLTAAGEKFTTIIIDTPGADNPATHNAMTAADLCLVPLRPTRPDGIAVKSTVEALMIGKRRFAFVLNQCSPSHNARAN